MNENIIDRNNKEFLNPYVCTDVVLFMVHESKLKVLLINREKEPFKGQWALPGGFPLKKETTRDTAFRVLKQKAGLKDTIYIEQLYTFDALDRDPRETVFSVTYFALVPYETYKHINIDESYESTLFDITKLPKMAFDHKDIVKYAIGRLQSKLAYTNIAYAALPEYFTFTMLQNIYEIILEKKMDKRNFRKKIEQLELVKATKEKLTGKKQRPATLYRFTNRKLTDIKGLF